MHNALLRAAVVGAALLPAAAFAATAGSVTADLNMRQGPGSNYGVVATIPVGEAVTINGCIEGSNWCEVTYGGATGYAYSAYLTASEGGTTVTVRERPGVFGIVTAPVNLAATATGTIVGTLTGGVIDGENRPSDTTSSFQSPPEVIDYARNNPPSQKLYLDGEAVPGAVIPSGVTLQRVPDTQYEYASINGDTVVVDAPSRTVVYVIR